uniref:Uncharacterized protein n=1 Tax=Parastrongyloides trichosuri TaxID=131310 RepID=A0A0N4ZDJ0_PARTI
MKVILFPILVFFFITTSIALQLKYNEGSACAEDKDCWCYVETPKCNTAGRISGCVNETCVCYPEGCDVHPFIRLG